MITEYVDPSYAEARNSQAGKRMTDGQFADIWALAGIMNRHIHRTAVFKDKLGDHSHALARTEKFDAHRANLMIRDVYEARYGEEMNQTRKNLVEREANLPDGFEMRALFHARSIEPIIRDGETKPYYQALDIAAVNMAGEFGISEAGARRMMTESFERAEGRDLYSVGKEWEEAFHKPVREAEKAIERQQTSRSRQFTRTR